MAICDVIIFYPDGRATVERRTTAEAVMKLKFSKYVGQWSTGEQYDSDHDVKIPHLRTVRAICSRSTVPEEDRLVHLIEVPT